LKIGKNLLKQRIARGQKMKENGVEKYDKMISTEKMPWIWWCFVGLVCILITMDVWAELSGKAGLGWVILQKISAPFVVAAGAALVIERLHAFDAYVKIRGLEELKSDGFLPSFLDRLSKCKGEYRTDYSVQIKIKPFMKAGEAYAELFQMHIDYSYKYNSKEPIDGKGICFRRRPADDDKNDNDEKKWEFFWESDETSFPSGLVGAGDYEAEWNGNDGEYSIVREDGGDGENEVMYRIKREGGPPKKQNKPITVSYSVRFPVESQAYFYLEAAFPIRGVDVRFDFSETGVAAYAIPLFGYKPSSGKLQDASIIKIEDRDKWMAPNTGIVFTWWKVQDETGNTGGGTGKTAESLAIQ
jgi:hypothetical protein